MCIHPVSDIERCSLCVQTTELMSWGGGSSVDWWSQRETVLVNTATKDISRDIYPSRLLCLSSTSSLPPVLFSHSFRATSLNFSLRSSPFPLPRERRCFPQTPPSCSCSSCSLYLHSLLCSSLLFLSSISSCLSRFPSSYFWISSW